LLIFEKLLYPYFLAFILKRKITRATKSWAINFPVGEVLGASDMQVKYQHKKLTSM